MNRRLPSWRDAYQDPRLLEMAATRGWTVMSIREDFHTLWTWSG